MLKSGLTLTAGRAAIILLSFSRNILLARLIGVEDYGVATTFAIIATLVEGLSDLGFERFVIQDREGDSVAAVAAVQLLVLARGAVLAAVVLVAADPIAALLGQPDLGWAYRIYAVVPPLRAMQHLDVMRLQRAMRFGPLIAADLSGVTASLTALFPLWLWLGDFRVMLGLLFVDSVVRLGTSHLLAERPYRLGWDGAVAFRALNFGWPLLAGGSLTFAVMQGERLIVANRFDASDLGLFSAALTLTMAPTLAVLGVINAMFLPLLSREQDNEAGFRARAELLLEALLVFGLGMMVFYVLLGPAVLRLVFGAEFAVGAPLAAILGITYTLRMIRAAPTNISIAMAHTGNLLIANAVRLISFPIAYLIALRGGTVEAIALTGLAGETASLFVAHLLAAVREGLWPAIAQRLPIYGLALVLVSLLIAWAVGFVTGPLPAAVAVILFGAIILLCRRLCGYLARSVQQIMSWLGH